MPPLPPPEPKKGRGRRKVHGEVPAPLPPISKEDFTRRFVAAREKEEAAEAAAEVVEVPHVPAPAAEVLTDAERDLLHASLAEIARRKAEALRLFKPMPEQERFFASDAAERIALGGNRGGKTTVTSVEIARAVTGQDPYRKYPERDGRCILVGRDLKHCSKVFYEKLFKPGAFKVIRDLHTGEWRSYNPNDPDDKDRADEAKLSPPLIPKRFYDEDKIAWENKKENLPSMIPLNNGWTIYLFAAGGIIPQGWDVDMVVFDEEITVEGWYPEMQARLLDRRKVSKITGRVQSGKFMWSATPQAGTQQLYALKTRADNEREAELAMIERGETPPPPTVECFQFGLLDNSFMDPAAIQELINKYADNPEEYEVRVKGNFALLGARIYAEFMPKGVHGIDAVEIGSDWTRVAAIDPGHQVCAVLFAAIPPPTHPMDGQIVIYEELYIKKCNAILLAENMKRVIGSYSIHSFIIDHRAGRQTDFTSGRTNEQNYALAFEQAGVECETTKSGFTWGSDDVKAGIEAVRTHLHVYEGRSKFVFVRGKCKWLFWELDKYSYRKSPDGKPTDEPIKLNDHLADCLRYLAMANLKWIKPQFRKRKLGYTTEALNAKRERAKARAKANGGGGGIKVY